jgi:hypothetical protein
VHELTRLFSQDLLAQDTMASVQQANADAQMNDATRNAIADLDLALAAALNLGRADADDSIPSSSRDRPSSFTRPSVPGSPQAKDPRQHTFVNTTPNKRASTQLSLFAGFRN